MGNDSKFSAADAALGYLYQVKIALLLALRRIRDGHIFVASLEVLDDVTFQTGTSNETELLQIKHHRGRSASLADASSDLWKSLRIWLEGSAANQIPSTADLYLITTCVPKSGSAASLLGADSRDIQGARAILDSIASTSSNRKNAHVYKIYLATPLVDRIALLKRITIIGGAPKITDLDGELRREIYWASPKEHYNAFVERLEGWWNKRVICQLTGGEGSLIGSDEIDAFMSDLREQFKSSSLPIDEDLRLFLAGDEANERYTDYIFVRQLSIINVSRERIRRAIQDYYKAFEQRSRWVREDLVLDMDLSTYERRLCDEWSREFESARDELGEDAGEKARSTAARSILKWAEVINIPIRPNVVEPFVCRGSLQMLADEMRIGWHPDFRKRLIALVGAEAEIA